MKKDFLKLAALAVVAIVVIAGLPLLTNKTPAPVDSLPPTHSATSTLSETQTNTETVLLSIDGLYTGKQIVISKGETVLGVLQAMNAVDPKIQLSTKTYSGLGTLVDGIGANKNGTDKKYWQYKVNGVMPQIGAGQYKLHAGDSIDWIFTESQE